MDPVGKNSELNKLLVHKFASQKAREFVHPSQSTWVAHWMNLCSTQAEQHKFKLPYLGMNTKRSPDQNPSRSMGGNQLKELKTDLNIATGCDENGSLRDGHGLVEVLPTLLLEKAIPEFDTDRSDVLFELVTRGPNDVVCPLPIAVRPSNPLPPASRLHSNPLESLCPVISAGEMFEVPFSQKTNKVQFASGQSSLSHANAISGEKNPFPLLSSEHNKRESLDAVKPEGSQLEDLETRSEQNSKPDIGNGSLFGVKLDENDFVQRATYDLMHGKHLPRELRPSMCYENKNIRGKFINAHEEQITCIHSTYFTNGNHRSVSSLTSPCSEKKMKVLEHNATSNIHFLPGDFISACTADDEGRIIHGLSGMKFSESARNHTHGPKSVDTCYKSPHEIATCSIRDGAAYRIHTILDEVKEVLGGALNVLEKDQPYLIMKRTDVSLCKERSVSNQILDADQNAFYRTVDLFPSCYCCKRAVKYELSNKVCKIDVLTEDVCGSHCKSFNDAEHSLPGSQRISSPKARPEDEIHVAGGCYEACTKKSHALPISRENDQCMNEINGTKVLADSVQFSKKSNCCDIRKESSRRRQLDLNTDPESSGQTVDTIDKDFVDVDTSCEHYHSHNERKSLLNAQTKALGRNTEFASCSNPSQHVTKIISASSAHELDSENQCHYVDWTGSSSSAAGDMNLDPRTRWVKRLKNSVGEAFGTKRSIVQDIYDETKGVRLFNKSPSKPAFSSDMCESKQKSEAGGAAASPLQTKSAAEVLRGSREIFSNPWIKRLHPSELLGIQLEAATIASESERRKDVLGMQAKDFPSIGAMVLMGKVLCNFMPCSFAKTGSSTVWRTENK